MTPEEAQQRVLQFFAMSNNRDPEAFEIVDAATDAGQGLDRQAVYTAVQALWKAGLLERDPADGAVTGLTRARITPAGIDKAGMGDRKEMP